MKKIMTFIILLIVSCEGCSSNESGLPFHSEKIVHDTIIISLKDTPSTIEYVVHNKGRDWLYQDINNEKSCDIVLMPNMKILKIGNQYTATYDYPDIGVLHISATPYLDFSANKDIQFFTDTCALKERVRKFICLKIIENISHP